MLVALGEICNFSAYAFQPAIVVAPLGALSVAVSAVLSTWLIKERLSFSGSVGITQCIFGSVLIVLYAPVTNTTKTVDEFFYFVLKPGFLVYSAICAGVYIYLVYFAAKKYGQSQPAVFISIVAIVGSYLVLSAQGFGSSLVYSIGNPEDNQFKNWAIYPLLAFVIASAISQIVFINKALNCFSPSVVAPINYVFFTTMTIISSAVLFQGFNVSSVSAGISMLIGFLVIIGGVSLLFQYSLNLNKLRLLSNVVQDIDDADDAQSIDENPIKLLNEDIAGLTRTSSVKSSRSAGRIIPDHAVSTESFNRRHSLEPVSFSRKEKQENDDAIELCRRHTENDELAVSSRRHAPSDHEMQEISSSKTQIIPETSKSSTSNLSKVISQGSLPDPLNQLLLQNSILALPARFGDIEDSNSELLDSSKNSTKKKSSNPSDHIITLDHTSSKQEEDWMW